MKNRHRFLLYTLFLFAFFLTLNTCSFAAEIIRINNKVLPDGTVEKTISISSRNKSYFSGENPLIPSDPIWKMGDVEKNGEMYVQKGTAIVKPGSSCLDFEDVNIEMEKDGIYQKISYKANLNYEKKLRSSGKFQTLAFMVTPIAREIAGKAKADPDMVSKMVQLSGFAIDKMDQLYQTIKLTEMIGSTEIRYRVELPSTGLFVNSKDYKPSSERTFNGKDLFGVGSTVKADTRFLPPAVVAVVVSLIIFSILVILGAGFFVLQKARRNKLLEETGDIPQGNFKF